MSGVEFERQFIKQNPGCTLKQVLDARELPQEERSMVFVHVALLADLGEVIWANGKLYYGTVAHVVEARVAMARETN